MSDTNYMNTYVNLVVETVHGYLNDILQLKTQLSVINGLISEKDQAIASLEQELISLREEKEKHQGDESEMQKLRDNAASWEFQYNNMANKVSHMDALTNQFNDIKRQYIEKTQEVERIQNDLNQARNDVNNKQGECDNLRSELESKNNELESTKSKLEKLLRKEEKKSSVELPKKDINKDSKPLTMTPKVTKVETKVESKKILEETDDF